MNVPNRFLPIAAVALGMILLARIFAAEPKPASTPALYEYVTIRWDGKDDTHIIRPAGQVEFVGHELRKAAKPDRADNRSFYMNLAMNGLAKEGFEFAGISADDIIMKRFVAR